MLINHFWFMFCFLDLFQVIQIQFVLKSKCCVYRVVILLEYSLNIHESCIQSNAATFDKAGFEITSL